MMNLYDKDDGFRVFTLAEANAILPEVIRVTEQAMQSLEILKNKLTTEVLIDEELARHQFEEQSGAFFERWAEEVIAMGTYPKGYFTVDFKSPVPDTLFCWTYGEDTVSHTHKVFQGFKDRVPIENGISPGFQSTLN